jgi:small subunit ribosomal protein S17
VKEMDKNKPKEKQQEDITGLGLAAPKDTCEDKNCPFHGKVTLHGKRFSGIVESARMKKSASIMIERTVPVRKYDRYIVRKSSIKVHNPECISAKEGDKVEVVECRPISKTKHFVIVRKM